ncbi:putative X8 domain-containing protein [Helianthus anomalus]
MSPEPSHLLLLRLLLFFSTALPLSSAAATLHQQQQQSGGVSLNLWCVAKNNAEDSALQSAIDWACGAGGSDCSPIQQGGPCYDGSDIRKTASYAFNDYCTKNGMTEDTCNFANTAALTSLDPSYSSCKFPSSMEGKTTQGTAATTGAGTSTADITSKGVNVAYGGMLSWCLSVFIVLLNFV